MAEYKGLSFEVKGLVRPCMVAGRKALFHHWSDKAEVVPPSYYG